VTVSVYKIPPNIVAGLGAKRRAIPAVPSWAALNTLNLTLYATSSVNSYVADYTLYVLVYKVRDRSGNSASVNRTVLLIDTTPPVIYLRVSSALTLEGASPSADFSNLPLQALAADIHDGSLTNNITVYVNSSLGTSGTRAIIKSSAPLNTVFTITYNVADSAGNKATPVNRTLTVVDTQPPELTLIGESDLLIVEGSIYVDSGAFSYDAYAGNLTDSIIVTGLELVNTSAVDETFVISYLSVDSAGNVARANRNVTIMAVFVPGTAASSLASSSGVIAGTVVACLIVVLVAVVLSVVVYRRRAGANAAARASGRFKPVAFANPLMTSGVSDWFHGKISREVAEARLADAGTGDGLFLVRSKGVTGREFVISFLRNSAPFHFTLVQAESGEYVLQSRRCTGWGMNVVSIIEHLSSRAEEPLGIQLSRPVPPPATVMNPAYEELPISASNPMYQSLYAETSLSHYAEPNLGNTSTYDNFVGGQPKGGSDNYDNVLGGKPKGSDDTYDNMIRSQKPEGFGTYDNIVRKPLARIDNPLYEYVQGEDSTDLYMQVLTDPTKLDANISLFVKRQNDDGHDTYMAVTTADPIREPVYAKVAKLDATYMSVGESPNPGSGYAKLESTRTLKSQGSSSNYNRLSVAHVPPVYELASMTAAVPVYELASGATAAPIYAVASSSKPSGQPAPTTTSEYGYLASQDPALESTDDFGFGAEEQDGTESKSVTRPSSIFAELENRPPWLMGIISREEAENRLHFTGTKLGTFLVRQKDDSAASFAMSIVFPKGIVHHLIEINQQGQITLDKRLAPSHCYYLTDAVEYLREQALKRGLKETQPVNLDISLENDLSADQEL
jgi:hypothetical protein